MKSTRRSTRATAKAAATTKTRRKRNQVSAPPAKATRPPRRSFAERTAGDVMVRRVVTVPVDATLTEVERVLADNKISGVPVVDEEGCVLGVLSVRDLIEHHAEEGRQRRRGPSFYQLDAEDFDQDELEAYDLPDDPAATAEQVMTPQVLAVEPDTPLGVVAATMVRQAVHRLLVQEDGKMVGIISAMDLLRAMAD
ncbi:MAG: CBS domain-containing protein [Planctomycetes bacterium]|nr:CBS domain-containing protein [Planctomycetota bacterium]